MIASISDAGVTSNAGLTTGLSAGTVTRSVPATSSRERSSITIAEPKERGRIDRGTGSRNVQRNTMMTRHDRETERAQLIRGIPISCNAIRTNHNRIDQTKTETARNRSIR